MAYTTIDDPSQYFNTVLHTGNSTDATSITGVGFQPDWVWTKCRSNTGDHFIHDSSRGVEKNLNTNDTGTEATTSQGLQSFDSDGFTMGILGGMNFNSQTYVNWLWKANGGTTSSNEDGSITSTVQANTTAGFSIVTYDGTGSSGATFGHGLGTVPNFIIIKNRTEVKDWAVYHGANTSAPETDALFLNLTDATIDNTGYWNDTAPTSSIITLGDNTKVNSSAEQHVAYCFAEKQGYSKFGSYTGNGNADGPFIYTGFKPAFTMIKNTQTAGYNWVMQDTKRFDGINSGATDRNLAANSSSAEPSSGSFAGNQIDFLSNGFKLRSSAGNTNAAQTYVYMAFAEHPFVSSEGAPTTAR